MARPRQYTSHAVRQRAYRLRQQAGRHGEAPSPADPLRTSVLQLVSGEAARLTMAVTLLKDTYTHLHGLSEERWRALLAAMREVYREHHALTMGDRAAWLQARYTTLSAEFGLIPEVYERLYRWLQVVGELGPESRPPEPTPRRHRQ
jgi:hypothetical protein